MGSRRWGWLVTGIALATATVASAQQDHYRGKEFRILVGYASGGGYDSYARVVAQHLGQHIPGAPTVIVQNMPGADGLALANHMAQRAPSDGSVIALTNRNLAVAPILGLIEKASVQYDPAALFWIANLNVDTAVVVVRKAAGFASVEDLKRRELVVGSTGLTAPNAVYPHVINNLIGTRIKVVSGYPSTSHLVIAMERGELDGNAGWIWSSFKAQRPDWISSGTAVVLLQLGTARLAELPNVPLITDYAKTDKERRALELAFAADALGRPFFAPPQTPGDVGRILRAGFAAMAKSREFQDAAARAKLDIVYQDGPTVEDLVKRLVGAPPDTVDLAKRLMHPAGTVIEQLAK